MKKLKSAWPVIKKTLFVSIKLTVLPVLFLASLFVLNERGHFNIRTVDIQIEEAYSQYHFLKPEIEKIQENLNRYKGMSLWSVPLNKISDQLAKEEWIESSRLTRAWPQRLQITLRPLEIKMLYINQQGQFQPVVKEGEVLASIPANLAPDVALLQGSEFAKNQELRKKAVKVLEELPAEGLFSKRNISEMSYNSKDGFWISMMTSNMKVKLGEDQIALKSRRVSQVMDYLNKNNVNAKVIDANLSKKVLVRTTKE